MTEIKPIFAIGAIVFLITDLNQNERIVTGYVVRQNIIIYYLSFETIESLHYDFEIATDKNWKK